MMTEATHMCSACAIGLYSECEYPEVIETFPEAEWIIPCAQKFALIQAPVLRAPGDVGRPVLAPGEVTDPTSTGRKRAALLAPILTGQVCAWAHLKYAGGGTVPILGCNGHALIETKGGDKDNGLYQGDRHHGPDKNTLNNAVGANLHSICVDCHHRWHELNDPGYDPSGRPGAAFPFLPVQPYFLHNAQERFTDDEYAQAEEWWALPAKTRGPYPFKPPSTLLVLPASAATTTLDDDGENPFPETPFDEIGEL